MLRTKTINRQNEFEAYYLIATRTLLINNHVINMNSFEFPANTSTLIAGLGFNIIRHNNREVAVVSIPDDWDVIMSTKEGVGFDGYTEFRGPNNITLRSFVGHNGNNFLLVSMPDKFN